MIERMIERMKEMRLKNSALETDFPFNLTVIMCDRGLIKYIWDFNIFI